MQVYYLDHYDVSGVFSSLENAIASFRKGAERCGYDNIKIEFEPWGATISYRWYHDEIGVYRNEKCYIYEYELDEDNFGPNYEEQGVRFEQG